MRRISQSSAPLRRTAGFTIVEILVVVAIFTVLLTLLLPAMNNARESSRRASCISNQVRLANGIAQFSSANVFMPSLQDRVEIVSAPGTFGPNTSWFAMLLPYLNHNDLYARMQRNISVANTPLAEAMCPSGLTTNRGTGWLCYGVNNATADTFPWDGALGWGFASRRSLEDISARDGLTNTFLTADKLGITTGGSNDWDDWSASGACALGFRSWNVAALLGTDPRCINRDIARSSSPPRGRHPGGVVMTSCDGRAKFLNENVAPHIFGHLTTSYSVWNGASYFGAGTVNSSTARYWLIYRSGQPGGAPLAAQEPLQLKETDYCY